MLCLICWLDGEVRWVLDPRYHEHVKGHAPDLASDEVADALLAGTLTLTRVNLPTGGSNRSDQAKHHAI
jgi:hypothetical protein